MPHPHNALTSVRIAKLRGPRRYADGNCLYLEVDAPVGNQPPQKRWIQRLVIHGRRHDIGLGSYRNVSLKEARQKAAEYLAMARSGGDPLAAKRKAQRIVPSFKEAAIAVHAALKGSWKNPKHSRQWLISLQTHIFPVLGDRRIDQIASADIQRALKPIWQEKSETARRVLQRMEKIMDWAKVEGHVTGDNPVTKVPLGLPPQRRERGHHSALPYEQVGEFIRALQTSTASPQAKLALELTILTATRTNEVIAAEWSEFDLDEKVWVIPASRMKAGRTHRVPLSTRALEILRQAQALAGTSQFVFPGRGPTRRISNAAMWTATKTLHANHTVHGFRSSFTDWVSEESAFPSDVREMALAHKLTNRTEAAYRRGDLLEKRRPLMEAWANYVLATPSARVVPIASPRKEIR